MRAAYEPMPAEAPPVASARGVLPQRQQEDAQQYHLLSSSIDDAEYPAPGQHPAASAGGQYDISMEEQEDAELQAALQVSEDDTASCCHPLLCHQRYVSCERSPGL